MPRRAEQLRISSRRELIDLAKKARTKLPTASRLPWKSLNKFTAKRSMIYLGSVAQEF
jgi:hypothetical protein